MVIIRWDRLLFGIVRRYESSYVGSDCGWYEPMGVGWRAWSLGKMFLPVYDAGI